MERVNNVNKREEEMYFQSWGTGIHFKLCSIMRDYVCVHVNMTDIQ